MENITNVAGTRDWISATREMVILAYVDPQAAFPSKDNVQLAHDRFEKGDTKTEASVCRRVDSFASK